MALPISADARLGLRARAAMLAGLLFSVTAVFGEAPRVIVEQGRVVGGNPMAGIKDGIIYRQSCEEGPVPALHPFSAALAVPVQLQVEIGVCPPSLPVPRAECKIEVEAPDPDERSWSTAAAGKPPIMVPLPELPAAGIYTLVLSCTVPGGGGPEPLPETALYVTYQRPLYMVSKLPPQESWYLSSCLWVTGLKSRDSEPAVLKTLLQGMFANGQRAWRYSLCQQNADGCSLDGQSYPEGELVCSGPPLSVCKCRWPLVLETSNPSADCNFTDCFGFTDILHFMAAVQGVGGLMPFEEKGRHGLGFSTPPTARSIDPAFTGNVTCGYRKLPCAYFWVNHSLQRRHHPYRIYDATYGEVHRDISQVVDQSLACWGVPYDNGNLKTFGIAFTGPGYGNFSFYSLQPILPVCSVPALLQSSRATLVGPPRWGSKAVPTWVGGEPATIPVEVDVKVVHPGTYTLTAELFSGQEPVSLLATSRLVQAPVRITGTWPAGQNRVQLVFSGDDLERAPRDRPLTLRAFLQEEGETIATLAADLPPIPPPFWPFLGERVARFPSDARMKREIVRIPGGRALRVSIRVHVKTAGPYVLQGRLSRGEETLVYSGSRRELATGDREVWVDFPIAGRGDGKYEVTLEIDWLGSPDALIEFEDARAQEIEIYGAADFR